MESRVLLDYEFAVAANEFQVRALITLAGRAPSNANRIPLNLSIVLDRSGSMSGPKLAAAREAAAHLVQRLHPEDFASVVAYDTHVRTVTEPATGAAQASLAERIRTIVSGSSTNLSGGWLRGRELVAQNLREGATHRILLLTDGLANTGITAPDQLVELCRSARDYGITTTTIGFGADYNERLLRDMADAGGGHAYYIERTDQALGIFDEEIEGLLTLAAQNVAVEIRPAAAVELAAIHHGYPSSAIPGGVRLDLGDLHAREPSRILLEFHLAQPATAADIDIADVRIDAHVLTEGGAIERQEIHFAIRSPLSKNGHTEPEVRREIVLLEAARAREAALDARARGDLSAGQKLLEQMIEKLADFDDPSDATIAAEILDLKRIAARYAARSVSEMDAKYLYQYSQDVLRAKRSAMERIARKGPDPDPEE